MEVERYADLLGKLKPTFIHHAESKRHLQAILQDLGCELEQTYFDVPRMRSSTSDGYLTTGIAYAWHPHRDTWYSAPPSQINWWLPIYELDSENAMAFHPRYWNEGVANSSAGYNYYTWNKLHRGESVARAHQGRQPAAAARDRAHGDRSADSPDLSGRRPHLVFRGANALERAQHVGRDTFQHRFSHRPSPRLGREKRRTERRRGLHGHGVAGLPARYRFDAVAGGCRRAL